MKRISPVPAAMARAAGAAAGLGVAVGATLRPGSGTSRQRRLEETLASLATVLQRQAARVLPWADETWTRTAGACSAAAPARTRASDGMRAPIVKLRLHSPAIYAHMNEACTLARGRFGAPNAPPRSRRRDISASMSELCTLARSRTRAPSVNPSFPNPAASAVTSALCTPTRGHLCAPSARPRLHAPTLFAGTNETCTLAISRMRARSVALRSHNPATDAGTRQACTRPALAANRRRRDCKRVGSPTGTAHLFTALAHFELEVNMQRKLVVSPGAPASLAAHAHGLRAGSTQPRWPGYSPELRVIFTWLPSPRQPRRWPSVRLTIAHAST